MILFKCRTYTLKSKDRNRFRQEKTNCDLRVAEMVGLIDFRLWCHEYNTIRKKMKVAKTVIEREKKKT